MSLSDWLRYGWLVEHEPSAGEIRDLFAVIERDLVDCEVEGLSPDWNWASPTTRLSRPPQPLSPRAVTANPAKPIITG